MWTGGSLGVVLNRIRGNVDALQSLDHIIIQSNVTNFDAPETSWGIYLWASVYSYSEAVVMRSDFNLPGSPIENWLVDTSVTKGKFVSFES